MSRRVLRVAVAALPLLAACNSTFNPCPRDAGIYAIPISDGGGTGLDAGDCWTACAWVAPMLAVRSCYLLTLADGGPGVMCMGQEYCPTGD
jgi:hypothetical protein